MPTTDSERGGCALVVAHPGHEIALHGWLEETRPLVFVLTDGSGHSGDSRIASTRALLLRAGACPGALFGACSDRRAYEALLAGDAEFFRALAVRLASALVEAGISTLVADPAEGYNPVHDVCRLVADAAARAAAARGVPVDARDFPLTRPAGDEPEGTQRLVLGDAEFARKRAAAEAYAEMSDEVDAALAREGAEAWRVERLRPVDPGADPFRFAAGSAPGYETVGARRVEAGRYAHVIRFREHIRPVAAALGATLARGR